jgi:hypothetical protein
VIKRAGKMGSMGFLALLAVKKAFQNAKSPQHTPCKKKDATIGALFH